MAHYLVTGGGGFIGSNLCDALIQRGEKVRVLDNFATGRETNLEAVVDRIDLLRGDVRDARAVELAMDGIDYVLHEAALPSVPRSIDDPLETDRVNVLGTLNVLDAARRAKVKRVVFAASSSAYGETPTLPKVETMVPSPLSPYAVSKLAGEGYCHAFYRAYGLETVALRYFNVFGPRQDPESQYAAVVPRFITAALRGEAPTIYGDGEQTRDFCHIDNCVEANLRACAAPDAPGKVFNVACGARISLADMVRLLGEMLGRPVRPRHLPARRGDIKHSLADITQARSVLGYTAGVDFATGLQRTLDWYRQRA